MNLHAICHIQKSNYAYAYKMDELHIRLRTAKDDCTKVSLMIAEKHRWSEKEAFKMQKVASDHLFDYYQYCYSGKQSRLGYYFEISDDNDTIVYSESGFTSTYDDQNAYFHYFQFPYMNEVDVHITPSWVNETVFYQIFVDRFCNGGATNDKEELAPWGEPPGPHSFYGGDLQGILNHLDYFVELGVNGLYLTPIFSSPSNHKYDTIDYKTIDPMFGDKNLLSKLVEEAHKKGIRIILDGVFNHCSWYFAPFQDVMLHGEKSKYKDWFYIDSFPITRYTESEVNDYSKPFDLSDLNYSIFGTSPNMPKLNTENKELRNYLLEIVAYWMEETKIDGWRLDVSDEVSHDFWREFRKVVKAINSEALILGENWHNAYPWLHGDQFDGVMNYPFTKSAIQYFALREKEANDLAADLSHYLMWNSQQVTASMLNLLDSHDTVRFLTWCEGDEVRLKMALMLLFTYAGMPGIYYGTEIGMTGKGDPDCRRTFEWDRSHWNKDLFVFTKKLIQLRRTKKSLQYGNITIDAKDGVFYLTRQYKDETIVTILNITQIEKKIVLPDSSTVLVSTGETRENLILPIAGVIVEIGSN